MEERAKQADGERVTSVKISFRLMGNFVLFPLPFCSIEMQRREGLRKGKED